MNDLARETLIQAALQGQPQVRGWLETPDGRCALAVLWFAADQPTTHRKIMTKFGLSGQRAICPECEGWCPCESDLVIHLNDFHGCDFLTIARKMP